MVAFATQSGIQTTGGAVRAIGSNGSGRSKLMSAAELRAAAESYSSAQVDTLLNAKLNLSGGTLTGPLTGTNNRIDQRNGLNAQAYNLFETYTSETNFGALCLKATASGHQIGSARGTSGSNRAVQLGHFSSAGAFTSALSVATDGAVQIGTAGSGNIDLLVSGSGFVTTIGSTVNYVVVRSAASTNAFFFNGSSSNGPGLTISSNLFYAFSSGTNSVNSQDTALGRNSAGVVEINNGTAGTFRDLIVRNITLVPPTSRTLTTNGQFTVEMTSNTAGNFVYRGSDGTTRRMALTFV